MASLEETLAAMGLKSASSGERRKPSPKWLNPGDAHAIVVTGDWYIEPQKDINATWDDKYMEKQEDGKWKAVAERNLTDGSERFALEQTTIPGKLIAPAGNLAAGADVLFTFASKEQKDALMDAMVEFGDVIKPGVGLKVTFTRKDGAKKKWVVKLAQPKGE